MLWMFSTPSALPPAQNNLFLQPQPPPPAPCPPIPSQAPLLILPKPLPVCLSQPFSILKCCSVPASLLASKQAFACLALPQLPSLYFQQKLQVPLCTLCAWGRKLHAHIVGLEGRGDKTNQLYWHQWQQSQEMGKEFRSVGVKTNQSTHPPCTAGNSWANLCLCPAQRRKPSELAFLCSSLP